jgi:DNA-binding transcriptional LysR family regulator
LLEPTDGACSLGKKQKQWKSIVSGNAMPTLPDLEAWTLFAKVAETGSFSRAAAEFRLSTPTVSKAIGRLEARIGAALFNRTSRRLSLTETGRRAATSAARILADAEAIEAEAMAEAQAPTGLVRVAVPMSFGIAHVAPLLPDLLTAHPGIAVDLHLSDEAVDLVGGGFDLALRIAALASSSLRARRLCEVRRRLVGSPAYFARHGRPAHPRDLAAHACLGYAYLPTPDRWHFRHVSGEEAAIAPQGPVRANNADAMRPALLAGIGLAVQPDFLIWEDLAAGRLEAVMTEWSMPSVALHVLTPPGVWRPARVAAVIAFLAARLVKAPWAGPR